MTWDGNYCVYCGSPSQYDECRDCALIELAERFNEQVQEFGEQLEKIKW